MKLNESLLHTNETYKKQKIVFIFKNFYVTLRPNLPLRKYFYQKQFIHAIIKIKA